MNKLKKLASLVLAMVMALALAAPAFAEENTDNMTTIRAPQNNHTYEVYQIFTGDLDEGGVVLSNVKWGTNGTGEAGEPVGADILTELQQLGEAGKSFEEIAEAVSKYVDFESKDTQKITNLEEITVHTGYYLLKDLGVKQEDGSYKTPDNETLSLYLVEVVGPTQFAPKAGTVEVDKKIVEGEDRVDTNEAAIGDVIDYEVKGKLPENYDEFDGFYYEFKDTLSKGLTFVNGTDDTLLPDDVDNMGLLTKSVVVTAVNGDETTDITAAFVVTEVKNTDGTTSISIKCPDLKTVEGVTAESVIVVNYSAVLNSEAEIGTTTGNPNTVKLVYSNDPNNSGKGLNEDGTPKDPTGETPEDKVITYVTQLTITKTDENKEVLTGAEFQLTSENGGVNVVLQSKETFTEDANGTYWKLKDGSYTTTDPNGKIEDKEIDTTKYESTTTKYSKTTEYVQVGGQGGIDVKAFVNEDGTLTFRGLGAGKYTLSETTTPDGYNTIPDITFEIEFTRGEGLTGSFSVKDVTPGYEITLNETNGLLATTIVNQSGATLPSTGGIGTTIFYVVGGVLAAGAVILLITKRRMNIEK